MDGLLLVDKPQGWTSFDVVAKVRGILRTEAKRQGSPRKIKVGHTGTLDPMATGLLVLAIGSYTKKVPGLTKQDKSYEAVMTLGATSTTDDAEGVITDLRSQSLDGREVSKIQNPRSKIFVPNEEEVRTVLQSFVGTIEQVPPQFSAIKIGGVKSYDAARKGQTVTYEPRTVTIHTIKDITYAYPEVKFTARVGSGTYIRSLARDVGEKLGTGAYLSGLRRTTVGEYRLEDAVSVNDLDAGRIAATLQMLDKSAF